MSYEVLEVKPLTLRIGAEIGGVDLTKPLSNRQTEELKDAIADYQVIFFRDQKLDHESHTRFGRVFGDLVIHSGVAGLPDYPEVIQIHADHTSKNVPGENWHSDLTCDPIPPMGSILYLHTIPPVGGDTMFASMYAAYDALSPKMKAYLEGMQAVHDGDHVYRPLFPDVDKKYNTSIHPIVRTHRGVSRDNSFVARISFFRGCGGRQSQRPDGSRSHRSRCGNHCRSRLHQKPRGGRPRASRPCVTGGQPRPGSRRGGKLGQRQLRHWACGTPGLQPCLPGSRALVGRARCGSFSILNRDHWCSPSGGKNHS